jgi:hypothetical protein
MNVSNISFSISNKRVNMKPNGIYHQYDLKKANLHYNLKPIKPVDHDSIVRSEISSMFQTPHYQSDDSRSVIRHAPAHPLTEVLFTIYTAYHSTLSTIIF